MEILSQLARHVVVDNRVDSLDIETARSEVGSHEEIHSTVSEMLQRFQSLWIEVA